MVCEMRGRCLNPPSFCTYCRLMFQVLLFAKINVLSIKTNYEFSSDIWRMKYARSDSNHPSFHLIWRVIGYYWECCNKSLHSSSIKQDGQAKRNKKFNRKIYKYTRDIFYLVDIMHEDISQSLPDTKTYKDFQWNLYNIEMLIDLYLPPLKRPFKVYHGELHSLVSWIRDPSRSQKQTPFAVDKISADFRKALTDLLKQEGYS